MHTDNQIKVISLVILYSTLSKHIWLLSLVRQCEWILGWTHNWISNSQRPLLSLRLDLIQTLPSDFLIGLRSCCSPRLTQYFRRHWIQFRQNQLRPISTNWSWSILLFQGTSNKRTILTPPVSNILKEVWHFEEMCPRLWNKQENYWNCQNCFGFQPRSI